MEHFNEQAEQESKQSEEHIVQEVAIMQSIAFV
jgi:hypothetical protein